MTRFLPQSIFDTIGGLPVHALAVHFAAVLIPLSALGLAFLVLVPRFRKNFFPLVLTLLAVSTVLAFISKESGEQLSIRVGYPGDHASLGDILFPASAGLFAAALGWFVIWKTNRPKQLQLISGIFVVVAAIGVTVLSFLVGHSGAQSTWEDRIAETNISAPIDEPSPTATDTPIAIPVVPVNPGDPAPTPTSTAKPSTAKIPAPSKSPVAPVTPSTVQLTAAEVAKHDSANDCWSIIRGKVYDLTSFASRHPGGQSAIASLCGRDGSSSFLSQHSGDSQANSQLSGFIIGELNATIPKPN
jgi:cytochrome b involved in lipid metabolism